MNFRFYQYFIFVFAIILAKTNVYGKNAEQSITPQLFIYQSAYSGHQNNSAPYIYFLGSFNPAQLCRAQSQRSTSVFKSLAAQACKFGGFFKFLKKSFAQTRVGYIRSSKLILFPFHVFW